MAKEYSPEELEKMGATDAPREFTPEELAAKGAKNKPRSYAPPREHSDDELGLRFGPASSDVPGEDQALRGGHDALSTQPELSPLEKQLKTPFEGDIAFLKEIAPILAGGALGKGASYLLGRGATAGGGSAASRAATVIERWLANNYAHGNYTGLGVDLAKAIAPEAVAAGGRGLATTARSAAAGGAAASPGVAAIGASGFAPEQETPEQKMAKILMRGINALPE